ncbi:MAG: hypothetical protein WD509_00880 [Candidatus Paceibacterota bacterium]
MNISVQSKIVVVIGLLFTPLFLVYGQSGNTTLSGNVTVRDSLTITGSVSKGSGTFVIDHPLDPEDKLLYHSFVESPDAKNIYDGVAVLGGSGEAVITLPDYFEALNTDFRYQFSSLENPSPNLHIQSEIKNNQFTIAGGEPGTKISWQVTGVRHDPYILANPITVEVEKGPDALVDKGEFLFPGLFRLIQ